MNLLIPAPGQMPENVWIRQFTHVCTLHTRWAHEPAVTVRRIRVRFAVYPTRKIWCEDGYTYDPLFGFAFMDTPTHVYRRRLLIQTIEPLYRVRLPRERVRL